MANTDMADAPSGDQAPGSMPRHVAIIMDGNGRWAQRRSLPRTEGHRQGVESVRRTVRRAGEMEIAYLTLFSFSSENWSRPAAEVNYLIALLKRYIHQDLTDLHRHNVRVRVIGRRDNLEQDIVTLLEETENLTCGNTGMTLVVAFNYGSKDEMARAVRRIAADIETGTRKAGEITPDLIDRYLDTAGIPDPDLVIRTGGEQRLSNFLLWQCAYSEFVYVPVHWPEFTADMLLDAVRQFRSRERRFGGVAVSATR